MEPNWEYICSGCGLEGEDCMFLGHEESLRDNHGEPYCMNYDPSDEALDLEARIKDSAAEAMYKARNSKRGTDG